MQRVGELTCVGAEYIASMGWHGTDSGYFDCSQALECVSPEIFRCFLGTVMPNFYLLLEVFIGWSQTNIKQIIYNMDPAP